MERNVVVGMLSSSNSLDKLKVNCSIVSVYYNIEFFYFTEDDVNYKDKTISGSTLYKNEWERKQYHLEEIDVIYDRFRRISRSQHKDLYSFLSNKTFTHSPIEKSFSKIEMYNLLSEYEELKKYIIPYKTYTAPNDAVEYLHKYNKLIIKPADGKKGTGLFLVTLLNDGINIVGENIEKKISEEDFLKWIEETVSKKIYVLQKYIQTRTLEGRPFDLRALMFKGEKGNWNFIKLMPRIGIGEERITLLIEGGYIGYYKPFIVRNFGEDKFRKINKEIRDATLKILNIFENRYDKSIGEAGLDFAISKEGELYLIELNIMSPGFLFSEFEVAKTVLGYAKFLVGNNAKN